MNELPKAIFSEDRQYRYILTRTWDASKGYVMFCGLNPSTADENLDDPTVKRWISFAKRWGYGGIIVVNLFAFRATDPKQMKKVADPIGEENNYYIIQSTKLSKLIVACWGNHGYHQHRDEEVIELLKTQPKNICCFGLTNKESPKHPLYLKADTTIKVWI